MSTTARATRDALVVLGERANPKRSFLLVSTVLGKHVPLAAARCRLAGAALGLRVAGDPRAEEAGRALHAGVGEAAECLRSTLDEPARMSSPVTVVGFAETATGLAHQVAGALDAGWLQCTTRHPEAAGTLAFAETHSHAPDQWLMALPAERRTGTLVLVDDELSTGATAAALLERLAAQSGFDRLVVACLLDSRPSEPGPLEALGARLCTPVEVVCLQRAEPVDAPAAGWSAGTLPAADPPCSEPVAVEDVELLYTGPLERHGLDRAARNAFAAAARDAAHCTGPLGDGALVLGCGEHLAFGQLAALEAGAGTLTSSTTRSPALVAAWDGYPLADGLAFAHPEEPARPGYAYNVAPASRGHVVVHFSEPAHRRAAAPLFAALARAGAGRLTAVTLTP